MVMFEISELLDVERSSMFLFDWKTMELRACFSEGVNPDTLVVPLRMGVVGTAILRCETLNIVDVYQNPYFNPRIDSETGYKTDSLIVVPMVDASGRIQGGIEFLNKHTGRFSDDDEAVIGLAATRLAEIARSGKLDAQRAGDEVAALRECIGCDRGALFVLDEGGGQLVALHADGAEGVRIALNLRLGIAGLVALTKQAIMLPEAAADPRFDPSFDRRTGFVTRDMLCVPLLAASGESLGVIQAINKREGRFSADDEELLTSVAGIVAIAVENALLIEDGERQFHSVLETLAASIDARDAMTAGHSMRVAEIAIGIGRVLGFTPTDLDVLRVAAILHDYGKIGTDDAVLKKRGRLESDEYEHIKKHASTTFDILEKIYFARKYRGVPLLAASHHEMLDGSGYPRGLTAKEIPFMSKILTVADVFEALTADRHYRKGMETAKALAILDEGVGSRFDPNVVSALRQYLSGGQPVYG